MLLSREKIEKIDDAGRRILERVGIKILDDDVFERLKAAGADADGDTKQIRFAGKFLEKLLKSAPSQFVMHGRDGKTTWKSGREKCISETGAGCSVSWT